MFQQLCVAYMTTYTHRQRYINEDKTDETYFYKLQCVASSKSIIYLWSDDGLAIEAETCCHLVTLNKINIHNTSCVLTCESLLLTWILIINSHLYVLWSNITMANLKLAKINTTSITSTNTQKTQHNEHNICINVWLSDCIKQYDSW